MKISPSTKNGGWQHFGCPDCGNIYHLPFGGKDRVFPWCVHNNYTWPPSHWQDGEKDDPDWRERWTNENKWVEMRPVYVYTVPMESTIDYDLGPMSRWHNE